MPVSRILMVAGGVVAGFFAVLLFSQQTGDEQETWWSQVREFAAEREVELRDALGLNDVVSSTEVA